jgi:uncharacterized membrane protein YfcA
VDWSVTFPVSGVEVSPLVPPLVAFVISFITSMGGVSGAFLLLPFQMNVLGFTSPAVSATNQLYNLVAIPGGVVRYVREGRMVWPLTTALIVGTVPGVVLGAVVRVQYLPDPRGFRIFAGLVLLYLGTRMVLTLAGNRRGPATAPPPALQTTAVTTVERAHLLEVVYGFRGERYRFSPLGLAALSALVGVVGGVYGIGGGAITAPILVSLFGLPVHTVAGATLAATFTTSVVAVLTFHILAPFYPGLGVAPDWALGLLFGVGGLAGIYCGARLQKRVPARAIEALLALIILWVALRYVLEFLR